MFRFGYSTAISPGKVAAGADAGGAVHFLRLISHKTPCFALQPTHYLNSSLEVSSVFSSIKQNSMGLCVACLGRSVKAMLLVG